MLPMMKNFTDDDDDDDYDDDDDDDDDDDCQAQTPPRWPSG